MRMIVVVRVGMARSSDVLVIGGRGKGRPRVPGRRDGGEGQHACLSGGGPRCPFYLGRVVSRSRDV